MTPPDRKRPAKQRPAKQRPIDSSEGFNIVGTLLAGILFWGLVGYGIDRLVGTERVFLLIGVMLGLSAGTYLVIHRLFRS